MKNPHQRKKKKTGKSVKKNTNVRKFPSVDLKNYVEIDPKTFLPSDTRKTIVKELEMLSNLHNESVHQKRWGQLCVPHVVFLLRSLDEGIFDPHGNPIYNEIVGIQAISSFMANSLKALPDSLNIFYDAKYYFNEQAGMNLIVCKSLLSGRKMFDLEMVDEIDNDETFRSGEAIQSLQMLTNNCGGMESIIESNDEKQIEKFNVENVQTDAVDDDLSIHSLKKKSKVDDIEDGGTNDTVFDQSSTSFQQQQDSISTTSGKSRENITTKSILVASEAARFNVMQEQYKTPVVVDILGMYQIHLNLDNKITLLDYSYYKR